ncbi:hypothetical protein PENSPDRAFT_751636 [Peniophora sp. CONT]|nr:hypothetical protein PENSPDRAFT_751636 [Peniophora sp. CONT]
MNTPMPNEYMVMGYVSTVIGSAHAAILFNNLVRSRDFTRAPSNILPYQDGSYRWTSRPDIVLDYRVDEKGTVVPQKAWKPADVQRHVLDATLLPPVFFVRTDYFKGVDMSRVWSGHADIINPDAPAPLGGRTRVDFVLKWPGYEQEFKKKIDIKGPIPMSKLVERVTNFVERFINEATYWPVLRVLDHYHWRVGPTAITKDHLYIIGLIHVSGGVWQPILQFKGLNFQPAP